jgi:hypothetical protein
MDLFLDRLASPIGTIVLISDGEALRVLDFVDCEERMQRLLSVHYGEQPVVESRESLGIKRRMEAYFGGDLTSVDAIAVRTEGTPFQKQVWAELRNIAAGSTLSYGALAKTAWSQPRGGFGEWIEPDWHCGAVPSRDRFQRRVDGLWRRYRAQTLAAGARRRAVAVGYTLGEWRKFLLQAARAT